MYVANATRKIPTLHSNESNGITGSLFMSSSPFLNVMSEQVLLALGTKGDPRQGRPFFLLS